MSIAEVSEKLLRLADKADGDDAVVLCAMAEIVIRDADAYINLIPKIQLRTGLPIEAVRASFKRLRAKTDSWRTI